MPRPRECGDFARRGKNASMCIRDTHPFSPGAGGVVRHIVPSTSAEGIGRDTQKVRYVTECHWPLQVKAVT